MRSRCRRWSHISTHSCEQSPHQDTPFSPNQFQAVQAFIERPSLTRETALNYFDHPTQFYRALRKLRKWDMVEVDDSGSVVEYRMPEDVKDHLCTMYDVLNRQC